MDVFFIVNPHKLKVRDQDTGTTKLTQLRGYSLFQKPCEIAVFHTTEGVCSWIIAGANDHTKPAFKAFGGLKEICF